MTASLTPAQVFAILGILGGAFLLSFVQAYIGSRIGSDSPAHLFLVRQVRKYGAFFTRIPDLLNKPALGANPMYLHFLLARLPDRALDFAPYLLNPVANALHVGLFALVATVFCRSAGMDEWAPAAAIALFAFCPQWFHALSARNFGFSSRGTGMLLVTAFFASFAALELGYLPPTWAWVAMTGCAYLIFAFNTFSMQVLLIVGTLLVPIRYDATHLLGIAGGLVLFVAVHPRYSVSYLRYTWRFVRGYAGELAPKFILERRYSVWRDLVWDIPRRLVRDPVAGAHYAYENSLLVAIFLNPLALAAIAARFSPLYHAEPAVALATDLALAGMAAMAAISFRVTRFLGEPERYVEAMTAWITLAGFAWVWTVMGTTASMVLGALFALMTAGQVGLSRFLAGRIAFKPSTTDAVADAIRARLPDENVRLCSNNEQLTKLLLINDWKFSYLIAVGELYCGMTVSETYTLFPNLRKSACERLVRAYRLTVAVLQKDLFDTLFDTDRPDGLIGEDTIFENEAVRVVGFVWEAPREAGVR
ncbi:hypothetical protein ACWPMX_13035 [Tsuneonella sp. HG094]